MDVKTTEEIAQLLATITVTAEADGTFIVREDGKPHSRWATREIADRRAAHIRRFDAESLEA